MPRIGANFQAVLRTILDSQKLLAVSEGAELLYYKLLLASDCEGRFYGSPFQVLSRVLTGRAERGKVTIQDVESRLAELAGTSLLRHYEVDGQQFLELIDYFDPTDQKRKKVSFPENSNPSTGGREGVFPALGDESGTAVPNPGTSRGQPSPLTETPTPTETPTDTQGVVRAANAGAGSTELVPSKPKRKPPVNGREELAGAIHAFGDRGHCAPMDVELSDAADKYRQMRVKTRCPVWRLETWLDNFEAAVFNGAFDKAAMIAALETASRSQWKSVHPKQPTQRPQERDRLHGIKALIAESEAADRKAAQLQQPKPTEIHVQPN